MGCPLSLIHISPDLTGHTLMIYCGAGMTKPFQEIADSFKAATGCEMNVTYANAGQIQSQITTSEEGDMFIAGSAEELKPVESYVSESKALVKHIPVLAVQSGNPKNITSLAGLDVYKRQGQCWFLRPGLAVIPRGYRYVP